MKTIISILLLISMVVSGLASYHLFYSSDYNLSALLTITSYLSIVLCVYALTAGNKRSVRIK